VHKDLKRKRALERGWDCRLPPHPSGKMFRKVDKEKVVDVPWAQMIADEQKVPAAMLRKKTTNPKL
jgi:hypothetical protein